MTRGALRSILVSFLFVSFEVGMLSDELTYEAKSESARERDRFSVEIIQMAKELVLFCRDTIIAAGKAMSHRYSFFVK